MATTKGLAVGPEVGVGTEGKDFSWVDGAFGIVGAGEAGLKWVSASTAATSMRSSSAVKNEFSSENWTSDGESFVAREGIRVVIIGTGIDLVIAIIFIENQPGIDISDIAGDIDFLGKDEDLWEVIYSIVGFLGDINIAIDGEGAVHEHGEGVHELLTGGVASRDEVAAAIELIEIGGTIHGAEAGVSLMVELREAEIILRGSFIRGETGDGIRRISNNGITEAGLETGEDGGTDAGDAGFSRCVFAISDGERANIIDARDY